MLNKLSKFSRLPLEEQKARFQAWKINKSNKELIDKIDTDNVMDDYNVKHPPVSTSGIAQDILLGAGHELEKIPVGILRGIGVNAEHIIPDQKGLAFNLVGKPIGYGMEAMAGSGLLKLLGAALPAAATSFRSAGGQGLLGSMARGAAKYGTGGAVHGFITEPENRLGGAANEGLVGAAIGGLMPPVIQGAKYIGKNISSPLNMFSSTPESQAKNILSEISGASGYDPSKLEGIHQGAGNELISMIKESAGRHREEARKIFNPIFEKIGEEKINPTNYLKEKSRVNKHLGLDTKKLIDTFLENRTLENAHIHQSKLGKQINLLKKKNNNGLLDDKITALENLKSSLISDMDKKVNSSAPDLWKEYLHGKKYYYENVVPYKENPDLSGIIKGDTINFGGGDISSIFGKPDKKMLKVIEDLGEKGANRVAFLGGLGKNAAGTSVEKLINSSIKLDEAGLGPYMTPYLKEEVAKLIAAKSKRDALKRYSKIGGGALALLGGEEILRHLF